MTGGTAAAAGSAVIYVDANNGTNDSACLNGGSSQPCSDLMKVLEYTAAQPNVVSTIYIESGEYQINRHVVFEHLSDLVIANNGHGPVDILCSMSANAGLSFIGCSNIDLFGLTIRQCGARHNSTSFIFKDGENHDISFMEVNVSIYFENCYSINLSFVAVRESINVAVQFYYTLGTNYITNCNFTDNPVKPVKPSTIGGGLFIEFPYCFPGDNQSCNKSYSSVPSNLFNNSQYVISDCLFSSNTNYDPSIHSNERVRYVLPYRVYHKAFGSGGGLSIFFKGYANNNSIVIQDCTFTNNIADYGGGLYVEMQDNAFNNNVTLIDNVFTSNKADSTGGGASFGYLFVHRFGNVFNNTIVITNAHIEGNVAGIGGGMYHISTRNKLHADVNHLSFNNCSWIDNKAKLGSALDMSAFHPVTSGYISDVILANCSFFNNSIDHDQHNDGTFKQIYRLGSGAMRIDRINVLFNDYISFINNADGTALVSLGAKLKFNNNTEAVFENNVGHIGGAIGLYGLAFISVFENTTFSFISNTAKTSGGAIYSDTVGSSTEITSFCCIIRYYDILVGPKDWKTNFTFTNNTVNGDPSSIYVTSLWPCVLGRAFGSVHDESVREVFCWNDSWKYNGSSSNDACIEHITTDIYKFDISIVGDVTPGNVTRVNVSAFDDQGDPIDEYIFHAYSNDHSINVDKDYNYFHDEVIFYQGQDDQDQETTAKVTIDTVQQYTVQTKIDITFRECNAGLQLRPVENNEGYQCGCIESFTKLNQLICDAGNFTSKLLGGYWIGLCNNTNKSEICIGHCKNCKDIGDKLQNGYLTLDFTIDDVSENICQENSSGVLCSGCDYAEGYAPSLSHDEFRCVRCNSVLDVSGVFVFLFFDVVFQFVFLSAIYFIDVPLSSGIFHGPILFAQLITTVVSPDFDDVIPYRGMNNGSYKSFANFNEYTYKLLYGFFNLDFFSDFQGHYCLSNNVYYFDILLVHFGAAFFPLFYVIIFYFIFSCCTERCRESIFCARITNKANFLVTAILLCYTKVSVIICYLLAFVDLTTENGETEHVMYFDGTIQYLGPDHLKRVIVPVIIGSLFLILLPLLLICYRSKPDGEFFNALIKQFQEDFRESQENYDIIIIDANQMRAQKPNHALSLERFFDPHEKNPDIDIGDVKIEGKFTCCSDNAICSCHVKCNRCFAPFFNTSWSRHDFRWAVGMLFYFRLVMVIPYVLAWNNVIMAMLQFCICMTYSMVVLVFHPYKKRRCETNNNGTTYKSLFIDPNIVEAVSMLLLSMIIAISVYQYLYTIADIPLSQWCYIIMTICIWIPFFWIVIVYSILVIKRYISAIKRCWTKIRHCRFRHNVQENEIEDFVHLVPEDNVD
jgi:predicted outer membrane repeat protein